MNRRNWLSLGLLVVAMSPGCGGPDAGPKRFTLKGTVRAVDPKSGEVTIAHKAIPGFMPAMTMPFALKDQATLDELRPGDEVEGALVVQFEAGQAKDYDLTGLNVTKPSLEPAKDPAEALARPMVLEPGDEVPDFAMTTQDGQTVRLSELRGKVVALTFIYTRCPIPDFCPALDAKFADLASRLATVPARAERVRLLSISFDPDHDTPEVLRNHARMRGAKPPLWSFAVASHTELAKVAPGLGLSYGPDGTQVVHNRVTAVIDAAGKLARLEINGSWTPADLFKTLAELARKPAK